MATLHIENTVHDFDTWKSAFDKYDSMRREKGVRSYRMTRHHDDPNKVMVDLTFDSVSGPRTSARCSRRSGRSPQSRAELVSHTEPQVLELVDQRAL